MNCNHSTVLYCLLIFISLTNSLLAQSGSACDPNMIAHVGTFDGLIDELGVYTRALSADDIYALANP